MTDTIPSGVVDLAGGHLVQFDDPGTFAGLIIRCLEIP